MNQNRKADKKAARLRRMWKRFHSIEGKFKKSEVLAIKWRVPHTITIEDYKTLFGPCRFCSTSERIHYVVLYPKKKNLGFVRDNLQPVCQRCIPARAALRNFIEKKRGINLEG